MPDHKTYRFFLGANSPDGFVSFFDHLINLDTAKEVIIIKGGPGVGKSSFMRRAAAGLVEAGFTTEWIVCSADPDSLDGVVFPEIGVAFVDGSYPHIVEPKYPHIVEKYLDLGKFCDSDLISEASRNEIRRLIPEYRAKYDSIYRCINAARFVSDDLFATVFCMDVVNKIKKRVAGIIKREIPTHKTRKSKSASEFKQGLEMRRFLSGMTSKGNVVLSDTVSQLCNRIYEINDTYGYSHFMLSPILNAATAAGYNVYACYCPMNPETKLDHLLIPELDVAFFTVHSDFEGIDTPYRRIHLDAYIPQQTLRNHRQRLRFMRKTCTSLLDEVAEDLRAVKSMYSEIGLLYSPAVDYDSVYSLADEYSLRLLEQYGHHTKPEID